MEINRSFEDECLTAGKGNYIISGCPIPFMDFAEDSLKFNKSESIACCIKFTKEDIDSIRKILNTYKKQKPEYVIFQDYISAKLLYELFNIIKLDPTKLNYSQFDLRDSLDHLLSGNKEKYLSVKFPLLFMVLNLIKNKKIELDFFCYNIDDVFFQKFINDMLIDKPFNVKIFTTKLVLPTYETLSKQSINLSKNIKLKTWNELFIKEENQNE